MRLARTMPLLAAAVAGLAWVPTPIPFGSTDGGDEVAEFQPLEAVFRDAVVVGLGETTHGTSEFRTLDARLSSWLVTEMDFDVVALEASDAYVTWLNRYIVTGKGDPQALVCGLGWVYGTQELLTLVEWLRGERRSGRWVALVGIDVQDFMGNLMLAERIAGSVDAELGADIRGVREHVTRLFSEINRRSDIPAELPEAVASLAVRAESRGDLAGAEMGRLLRAAAVSPDIARAGDRVSLRDHGMAQQVSWWVARGHRVVVLAHAEHVRKDRNAMGQWLSAAFGSKYLSIALLSGAGDYLASLDGEVHPWPLDPPPTDSLELAFANAGVSPAFYDLRDDQAYNRRWKWRSIGSKAEFYPWQHRPRTRPAQAWDGAVWLSTSHATEQLVCPDDAE